MKKTFLALSFSSLLLFSFGIPAFAQTRGGTDTTPSGSTDTTPRGGTDTTPSVGVKFQIQNPFRTGDNLLTLMEFILNNIVLKVGGMLCVLGFIYAGFMYVMAQGNPNKIKDANKALLYTAIGTAILLGALVIQKLIETTFTQLLK
jgi:hypothetical protein